MGASISWSPQGLSRLVQGLLYSFCLLNTPNFTFLAKINVTISKIWQFMHQFQTDFTCDLLFTFFQHNIVMQQENILFTNSDRYIAVFSDKCWQWLSTIFLLTIFHHVPSVAANAFQYRLSANYIWVQLLKRLHNSTFMYIFIRLNTHQ
jgi:hypothetical protein